MTATRFIEPLDVLFFRGNRLFGEAGGHGNAIMPPWPSVFAGALRSAIVASSPETLRAMSGKRAPDNAVTACIGTAERTGSFRLARAALARRTETCTAPLLPQPADVSITDGDNGLDVDLLQPHPLPDGVAASHKLAFLPMLRRAGQSKPSHGWWLEPHGLAGYLAGKTPAPETLVHASDLWQVDHRLGIALQNQTGTTVEGALYTSEAVALRHEVGFAVGVEGADEHLPQETTLRLGGDGRAARMKPARVTWPEPDYEALAHTGRFRIVLTTPGLFENGWRLPGQDADGGFELGGLTGRVAAAAVGRPEVISGWDLLNWKPKPAQRFVPAGAVYWIDRARTDANALRRLVAEGLPTPSATRKAEGFNTILLAAWPTTS